MVQNLPVQTVHSIHGTDEYQVPALNYAFKRTGRRAVASNLSVIVWDQARTSFFGTLDAAQWIEAITQAKNSVDEPWREVENKTQLYGKVSEGLGQCLGFRQYQFFVTFMHNGRQYGGFAVIRRRPDDFVLLHVDNGFEEIFES